MSDMREVLDELQHINRRLSRLEDRVDALETKKGSPVSIDCPENVWFEDDYGDVVTFAVHEGAVKVEFPGGGSHEVFIEIRDLGELINYLRAVKAYLT